MGGGGQLSLLSPLTLQIRHCSVRWTRTRVRDIIMNTFRSPADGFLPRAHRRRSVEYDRINSRLRCNRRSACTRAGAFPRPSQLQLTAFAHAHACTLTVHRNKQGSEIVGLACFTNATGRVLLYASGKISPRQNNMSCAKNLP